MSSIFVPSSSTGTGALNFEPGSMSMTFSTSATQNALGAYVQLTAAVAHTVIGFLVQLITLTAVADNIRVVIATGAGGSEANKVSYGFFDGSIAGDVTFYIPIASTLIPKGVRIAVAGINETSANARTYSGYVMPLELND